MERNSKLTTAEEWRENWMLGSRSITEVIKEAQKQARDTAIDEAYKEFIRWFSDDNNTDLESLIMNLKHS